MPHRITFKHVLGACIIFSLNIIIYVALTKEVPKENRELIIHTLGMIEGYIGAIVMYYYGDSAGSKQKTQIIKEQSEAKTEMIKEHLNEKNNSNNTPLDNNTSMGSDKIS